MVPQMCITCASTNSMWALDVSALIPRLTCKVLAVVTAENLGRNLLSSHFLEVSSTVSQQSTRLPLSSVEVSLSTLGPDLDRDPYRI
jgi:hypothetical protein